MKRLYSKDLGIIFLLTAVYIILISFPNFSGKYILDMVFFALFFLFIGYSLIALIRPEEDYKDILRKPVLLLEFSVLLTLIVSIILMFSYLGLKIKSLVMVLSVVIMVMSISAYIRRINHYNSLKYEKTTGREGMDEISQNIKTLTKKSVETAELPNETPVPKPESHPVETQSPNSEPDKLVVTEDNIREKFIKKAEEEEKPVETSKSATVGKKVYLDLVIIDLLSIFVLITYFVKIQNIGVVSYFIGLLYMLFLVGYPVTRIFFAGKNKISNKALIGISIGLSLPITSIIGTILNSTPYGLSVHNILFPLAVLTLILSLYANKRVKSFKS